MHFYELIKDLSENNKLKIYVDMDGVIASYDVGKAYGFRNKRPLFTNIETLRKISALNNVELNILSICRLDSQIDEKNDWLDEYASFFDRSKRNIISKESNPEISSKELKLNFLKTLNNDDKIVLIDDDNDILHTIRKNLSDVILFQDSELVD